MSQQLSVTNSLGLWKETYLLWCNTYQASVDWYAMTSSWHVHYILAVYLGPTSLLVLSSTWPFLVIKQSSIIYAQEGPDFIRSTICNDKIAFVKAAFILLYNELATFKRLKTEGMRKVCTCVWQSCILILIQNVESPYVSFSNLTLCFLSVKSSCQVRKVIFSDMISNPI